MNWFFIALVAPFLWAFVNIADNFLVAKYSQKEKERTSGGLVLFTSIIGVLIAFLIWIFSSDVSNIPMSDKLLLMTTGVLTILWIILYLYTLEMEDVSSVAPWFLTVPIFGFILGYVFLDETLAFQQIIGAFIVLSGVFLISLNFSGQKKKFRWKPIFYMLVACFLVAVSGVIFKYVTIENNFWVSSFWEYVGLGVAGLFIFMFVPKYYYEFMYMSKTGGRTIFTVNIITEIMTVSGNLLTNFALLLAPVTMVFLVGSFQPAIVLFLTIICTKFFPHIMKEDHSLRVLVPKIIAIVIMIIGSVILFI